MRPAPDRTGPGILPRIGVTVTAPVMDGFAGLAAAEIPVGQIVAAAAPGYLIFDDLPDAHSFTGIAVIMGAGLHVLLRERGLNRPPAPPPRAPRRWPQAPPRAG